MKRKVDPPTSNTPDVESDASLPMLDARQEVAEVFRKWINADLRGQLYDERLASARECLLNDITIWLEQLADARQEAISHHVTQFSAFVNTALRVLIDESKAVIHVTDQEQSRDYQSQEESRDYQSLVVGILTAQWLLLREVAAQRVEGSPYLSGLGELDTQVGQYYARLFRACETNGGLDFEKVDARYRHLKLASFAPMAHLGRVTELHVFNRRVPLMISIPFGGMPGAKDSDLTRMAIPHEVAHALFAQVPEFIDEIERRLEVELFEGDNAKSDHDRVLYETALGWTEEICADLFGTALAGAKFAESARWVLAGSDSMLGTSDCSHPPTVLRPIVHLLALRAIEQPATGAADSEFERALRQLNEDIRSSQSASVVRADRLKRQFRSMPALMFVTMDEVSNVLQDVVKRILEMELEILTDKNKSVASLLAAIHATDATAGGTKELEKWGEVPVDDSSLVIQFSSGTPPTYGTPGVTSHPICCEIGILRPICC